MAKIIRRGLLDILSNLDYESAAMYASFIGCNVFDNEQCDLCREETTWVARNEHPEWFQDTDSSLDSDGNYDQISQYVTENTSRQRCIGRIEDGDDHPASLICAEHLHFIATVIQQAP